MKTKTCLILAVVLLVTFLFIFSYSDSIVSANNYEIKLYPILDPIGRPFLDPIGSLEADFQLQEAYEILRQERLGSN